MFPNGPHSLAVAAAFRQWQRGDPVKREERGELEGEKLLHQKGGSLECQSPFPLSLSND